MSSIVDYRQRAEEAESLIRVLQARMDSLEQRINGGASVAPSSATKHFQGGQSSALATRKITVAARIPSIAWQNLVQLSNRNHAGDVPTCLVNLLEQARQANKPVRGVNPLVGPGAPNTVTFPVHVTLDQLLWLQSHGSDVDGVVSTLISNECNQ